MNKIIESKRLVPNIHLLTVEAPEVARAIQPGNFVIFRGEEEGERIPLTASDWDAVAGTITVIFMVVGHTTTVLSEKKAGDHLPTVVGPLGNPLILENYGTVMCLGGCYGIGSIYPLARSLKEKGNRVISVIEARSSNLLFWEEKLKKVSDELVVITRDGTRGLRGHVFLNLPQILKSQSMPIQRLFVNGCNFLMNRASEASRDSGVKTLVSLNTIMIDGTGMCGVCRLTVAGKMKFACVDGPYFDGHEVDWPELVHRRKMYLREESLPLRTSRPEPRSLNQGGSHA